MNPDPKANGWMMVAVRPAGQRVIIIGGGAVARRRAELFAAHGAQVHVYDPVVQDPAKPWPAGVTFFNQAAAKRDLQGAWLLVVATDDPTVNKQAGLWASELGLEVNRADDV